MRKHSTLLSIILTALVCLTFTYARPPQTTYEDVTFHRARFIGDSTFLDIDGEGIHLHSFLIADIIFVDQPQDGERITIGSVTFTFKDTASSLHEIQIGNDLDSTIDNARDVINDSHVVLRTSRTATTITLFVANTEAPTFTTTASGHHIVLTSFTACGAS